MSKYPRNHWTQSDWFSSEWLDRPMLKFRSGKIRANADWVPQTQKEQSMIGVIVRRTTHILLKRQRHVVVDMV